MAEVLANREIVTGLEKFKAKVEEGERKLGSLAKSALAILATGVRPEVPPEEMKQRRKDVIRMIENVGLSGTLKDFSEASRLLGKDAVDLIAAIPSNIQPPVERFGKRLESGAKSFEDFLRTVLGQGRKAQDDGN